MIKQKPMEHIKPEDVDIDAGIGINWDESHKFWEKWRAMSDEERDEYLRQAQERNEKLMQESAIRVRESMKRGVTFRHTGHVSRK